MRPISYRVLRNYRVARIPDNLGIRATSCYARVTNDFHEIGAFARAFAIDVNDFINLRNN